MRTLTSSQARRIALAAQGFADPRPAPGTVTTRHLQRVVDRVRVVQLDSVNVLVRSHYLPFYSRLGSYDTGLLDRMRDGTGPRSRAPRRLVEYWAHAASLVEPATWPLLGFRMRRAVDDSWSRRVVREHPGLLEEVHRCVVESGPLTAREVEAVLGHASVRAREQWGWNWSLVKECLEHLFWAGRITSAGRNAGFERRYADPSRVLPAQVWEQRPGGPGAPDDLDAAVELLRMSARALGVATERCLKDYFRLRNPLARRAMRVLLERGELEPVTVTGWQRPAYLWPGSRVPRRVRARALLSPFDSLVWQRERVEELFGFHYRLQLYVPAAQRAQGYYVLPFLLGEDLVGRVDVRADRAEGVLRVPSVRLEPDAPEEAEGELQTELETLAGWLGLGRVELT